VNQGRIDIGRFRNVVARQRIPRGKDGRITLAIDVSNWLRPDANTSPDRLCSRLFWSNAGKVDTEGVLSVICHTRPTPREAAWKSRSSSAS
jgi:hypothetical protein